MFDEIDSSNIGYAARRLNISMRDATASQALDKGLEDKALILWYLID